MHPPVECGNEVLLQASLAVVHQEAHQRLGHQVGKVAAHNVKVVGHQQPDHLNLQQQQQQQNRDIIEKMLPRTMSK
jgi:hypothetical protein